VHTTVREFELDTIFVASYKNSKNQKLVKFPRIYDWEWVTLGASIYLTEIHISAAA